MDPLDTHREVSPIHKHQALVAAGWKMVGEYQGILTRYLPPEGQGTEAHSMASAYTLHQYTFSQCPKLDDRNDPPTV